MQPYIYYIDRCNITRYTAAQRGLVPFPAAAHDPSVSQTARNMHSARTLVATVDFHTAASTLAGLSKHEKAQVVRNRVSRRAMGATACSSGST